MLIVGEQEIKDGTITARYYGKREQETFTVDALIEKYADSTP
jgi:threonyl-tRNA synthetase